MLNKTTDAILREKYIWLRRKVDESIDRMTQIKNLYLKEKREKSKSVHEALNVRYSIYENKDNE